MRQEDFAEIVTSGCGTSRPLGMVVLFYKNGTMIVGRDAAEAIGLNKAQRALVRWSMKNSALQIQPVADGVPNSLKIRKFVDSGTCGLSTKYKMIYANVPFSHGMEYNVVLDKQSGIWYVDMTNAK